MPASTHLEGNVRGPCPTCSTELTLDQRYCIECGTRIGPALSVPYGPLAATPRPRRRGAMPMPLRLAATLALTAVGFGLAVGTAMSTVLDDDGEVWQMPVAQAPPEPAPEAEAGGTGPVPPPPSAPPAAFGPSSGGFG